MVSKVHVSEIRKGAWPTRSKYPFHLLKAAGDVVVFYGQPLHPIKIQLAIYSYARRREWKIQTFGNYWIDEFRIERVS